MLAAVLPNGPVTTSFDTVVCPNCGSETSASKATCIRCGLDLTEKLRVGELPRAFDVEPRRTIFKNRALPYTERPEEILRLLDWAGVKLDSARTLIDVGCGPNILRTAAAERFPKLSVVGYDQYMLDGARDIRHVDLENAKLPYADGEVDVAVCSHVLEHVDNAHGLTHELCRVAKNVIILLPNSILWTTLAKVVLRRSLLPMVGLPLERPLDRHRWIYTVREASRWMRHVAGKWSRNLDIVYRTDWRLPTVVGRINPDLFVLEMSYVLTQRR